MNRVLLAVLIGSAIFAYGCSEPPATTSGVISPSGSDTRLAALYKYAAIRARAECTAALTDSHSKEIFVQTADNIDKENLLEIQADRYHKIPLEDYSPESLPDPETRAAVAAYHKRMEKTKHNLMRG